MASKDEFNLKLDNISRKVIKHPIPGSPSDLKNRSRKKLEHTRSRGLIGETNNNQQEEKELNDKIEKLEDAPEINKESKGVNSPVSKYKTLMDSRSKIVKDAYESLGTKPVDHTINRDHKLKDTFGSIFPTYGLLPSSELYLTNKKETDANWNQYEGVNKEYFNKMDHIKRYTEAMLKVASMRMKKK